MKNHSFRMLLFAGAFVLMWAAQPFVQAAYSQCNHMGGRGSNMQGKFFQKFGKIMKNQEALGLSDEQLDVIKKLKWDLKKEMIKQTAEIDVLEVDIDAALYEDTVDMEKVGGLIDQKYEYKKAKAKTIAGAVAELKKILTEEQLAKLKELHYQNKQ